MYFAMELLLVSSLKMSRDIHSSTMRLISTFFDGLIPEGWMLNIAERNWKINRRDRMALLLTCCRDCIGNVSVVPINTKEDRV